ncbi:PaaI family thioesterase [Actinospongicola halichondriae]|uniref:PaaI family thioesterase n=1 Tax=Actinospongicola halichondriae TaxID=3236844 RepID=UPI003D592AEA
MRADQFETLPEDKLAPWRNFANWPGRTYFPSLVGLQVEEMRRDYCRMRLPYRTELDQPAGVVHGGALATLMDTVVVPAIGTAYGPEVQFVTVNMNINYVGAVTQADTIAEGWVTRRGRTMAYCRAEATSNGKLVMEGSLVYAIRQS